MNAKILNLMQFARKAGKLVSGMDACERALNHQIIKLLIIAEDSSSRSKAALKNKLLNLNSRIEMIETGTQKELSQALGLPVTGIFGISDKNFAAKIKEYWRAEA